MSSCRQVLYTCDLCGCEVPLAVRQHGEPVYPAGWMPGRFPSSATEAKDICASCADHLTELLTKRTTS